MNERERLRLHERLVWQLLVPAIVGTATGACVALLVGGVENWAIHQISALPGIVPALFGPVALLLTYLCSRYITRVEKPSTSELYITLYHEKDGRVPREQVPGRVLATTATVGLGGSQGFESTSALIGATWSDLISRVPRFHTTADTRHALLAAGASAGIAAVFSSPAAGALYGMEVPYKRDVDARRLVPCAVAAVCSYATRAWLIGSLRIVEMQGTPTVDWLFLVGCLLVAIACGLGARLFAVVEHFLQGIGKRQSRPARALIGGTVLTLLAIAGFEWCGKWITFSSGYIATGWLQRDSHAADVMLVALLIRASGNLITVYGGGGGGVFTSLAANGAFVGEIVARLLNCDSTHTLALFGAACFLGAGYRLPLACMLFLAETGLGPAATGIGLVAVGIAVVFMGEESVSDAQVDTRS
jgi:CIC family chloride channel protein